MRFSGLEWSEVQELIADFLVSGERIELPAGFNKEEAVERARGLLVEIASGKTAPGEVRVDDGLKRVMYALVYGLLRDGRGGESRHARTVYEFIRDLSWTDDVFGEKEELLGECVIAARTLANAHVERIAIETNSGVGGSEVSKAEVSDRPRPERARVSEEELREVFQEHIALARAFLASRYGIGESAAAAFEQDFLLWFLRIARRSETPLQNPRALLLAACSEFGRAYERLDAARGRALSGDAQGTVKKPSDH